MDLKYPQRNANYLEQNCSTLATEYLLKKGEFALKPLRNRLEAIQKLKASTPAKGYRSFAGMVNFLSMYCPELQKLLKPIYDLTRKGMHFIREKEQQNAFEEITCRLMKPTILHMPNSMGRFHVYSDTSKFATGSALYQILNGKPK